MTRLSLLYVDDDADIRTIVRMALSLDPEFAVTEASSAEAALAIVSAGFVPDAALVDVMMPGMTGPELMERLHDHAATARLPVIVMTARARSNDIAFYKERGAAGVITKPFDPLKLAVQVRALIG